MPMKISRKGRGRIGWWGTALVATGMFAAWSAAKTRIPERNLSSREPSFFVDNTIRLRSRVIELNCSGGDRVTRGAVLALREGEIDPKKALHAAFHTYNVFGVTFPFDISVSVLDPLPEQVAQGTVWTSEPNRVFHNLALEPPLRVSILKDQDFSIDLSPEVAEQAFAALSHGGKVGLSFTLTQPWRYCMPFVVIAGE